MKTYATRPKETPSAGHTAQQSFKTPQAGATASSPTTWQASSASLPPVFGNPAGVLRVQQLKGNRAVGQMLTVQRDNEAQGLREPSDNKIHAAAAEGIRTPATTLPFLDRIQASFGRHSIGHIKAHMGPEAAKASRAMNALAYASGDHVVFGGTPDLWTTAHEAAHVVQQRAGVQLAGGIGRAGDAYERQADAVAASAVAGRSAEALLEQFAALPKVKENGTPASAEVSLVGNLVNTLLAPTEAAPTGGSLGSAVTPQLRLEAEVPIQLRTLGAAGLAAFNANAGGRPQAHWERLGDSLALDADVASFARIPAWGIKAVGHLAAAFAVDPGGRSADDWAAIAARAGNNAIATVIQFARIANWQQNAVEQLTTNFTANPSSHGAADWATVARSCANNGHVAATEFSRIANWTANGARQLAAEFVLNPGTRPQPAEWAQIAGYCTVDRCADAAEFARIPNWTTARVVTLVGSYQNNLVHGLSAAQTAALAAHLPNATTAPADAVTLSAIPNVGDHLDLITVLYARTEPTAARIVAIITAVAVGAYSAQDLLTLIYTHLSGLSVPLIERRITVHGLPQGTPENQLASLDTRMFSLNQTLNQLNMTEKQRDNVRTAFRMRNWTNNVLQNFLQANEVRHLLAKGQQENPAWWLLQFANERVGLLALGNNTLQRQVGVPPNRINVYGWIVNHVCNRHTFRHFDFGNIRDMNTMFGPASNQTTMTEEIVRIAGLNDIRNNTNRPHWDTNNAFDIGSYRMRVEVDPTSQGDYRFSQFFYWIAAGISIPRGVLTQMHQRNLFP